MADVWISAGSFLISIIFILSFIDKVRNWSIFLIKVREYKILPFSLVKPISIIFIVSDVYLGFAFLFKQINVFNIVFFMFMIVVYTIAVIINLYRGNTRISCGCGGVFENDRLSSLIVYRNVGLIVTGIALLNTNINFGFDLVQDLVLPLLVSAAALLLYGVIKEFHEHNLLMGKLRSKLVYFEE